MTPVLRTVLMFLLGAGSGVLAYFAFVKNREPLQPMNNERMKMVFGFGVLIEIGVLALAIGLGEVRMETSYGLNIILGSLATLAGGFAQWAFSARSQEEVNQTIVKAIEAALTERLKAVEAARTEAKAA